MRELCEGSERADNKLDNVERSASLVGLQPTVIASRAPHLLLEQSVMTSTSTSTSTIRRIVDVHRPSTRAVQLSIHLAMCYIANARCARRALRSGQSAE